MSDVTEFPVQSARTQRFTLGVPRNCAVAPDGRHVVFLRSGSGTDSVTSLWVRDVETDVERMVADSAELLGARTQTSSARERALRERAREAATGIVRYATDAAVSKVVFVLADTLYVAGVDTGAVDEYKLEGPIFDPRLSPDGRLVAYVSGPTVRVFDIDLATDHVVIGGGDDTRQYGLAEFIAAEEMGRDRGFWWSPDSGRLLIAGIDEAPVGRWWIADSRNPEQPPTELAYPAAGTANADVTAHLVDLNGDRVDIDWDRDAYPYLARVDWTAGQPPLLLVQSRDQRTQHHLTVDVETGRTDLVAAETDDVWLELIAGVPARTPAGRLVRVRDDATTRALFVDDEQVTAPDLHVRAVLDVRDDDILFTACETASPRHSEIGEIHVYRWSRDGTIRLTSEPGVHSATRGGDVIVVRSNTLASTDTRTRILRGDIVVGEIQAFAAAPVLTARPQLQLAGAQHNPAAVLLPTGYSGDDPLPVLLDPYGGPHGQRVLCDQRAYLEAQWLADKGFAVIVVDGRGMACQNPRRQRLVAADLAGTLDDQIDALGALAARYPLDLSRVAIRGWSFGGYLAALAVLRRPDVFHAAIAGAPVTDWSLYDTHYTERYLGHPDQRPEVYAANSLVTASGLAASAEPTRPLLLIHGLADDNVVAAHTLRLSAALLAAGRPHEVLPLSGATHKPTDERVVANLLLHQLDFLRRSLGSS
ncbi:prolyl oligopeptidase family serine peptidase [Nocardia beijingensis]